MMMADKAVEKIARGTSGKFETLYLGADGQFQWNILNPEETSFLMKMEKLLNPFY